METEITYTDRLKERVDTLQKEMHAFINNMVAKNPKLAYQDCLTTFFLLKISQLDLDKENIQSPVNQ